MIIYNAKIVPVTGKNIKKGFIETENGKIKSMGDMADMPRKPKKRRH